MRPPNLINGAVIAFLAATLLAVAPAALADEANQLGVRAIVRADQPCPTTGDPNGITGFRAGDTMAVCLAQPATTTGSTAISIGSMGAQVGLAAPDRVLVSIPDEPNPGTYAVSGTVSGSTLNQALIQYYPNPKPSISGLSTTSIARGENVRIDGENLNAPLSNITVRLGNELADVKDVDPAGKWVVASPKARVNAAAEVLQPVEVTVWDVPASDQTAPLLLSVKGTDANQIFGLALVSAVPLLVVLALVVVLYYVSQPGPRNVLAALLYDRATQTYSLSRAQFLWWLLIVAYTYSFLFFARGLATGEWTLPAMNGVLFTMLISTGTLLGAIGTSKLRGDKGSGAMHPAPSDLIMNGGVIAPERIQQLLWTVLAGVFVVWIVITGYQTATALPDIPSELLTLMGLSSAAYLTGKVIRSPGPIIRHVDPKPGTTPLQLIVSGTNLDKDGVVTVGGIALPKANVSVSDGATADINKQLVSQLTLTLVESLTWDEKTPIMIVNSDGQRAEWPTPETPPQLALATAPEGGAPSPAAVPA